MTIADCAQELCAATTQVVFYDSTVDPVPSCVSSATVVPDLDYTNALASEASTNDSGCCPPGGAYTGVDLTLMTTGGGMTGADITTETGGGAGIWDVWIPFTVTSTQFFPDYLFNASALVRAMLMDSACAAVPMKDQVNWAGGDCGTVQVVQGGPGAVRPQTESSVVPGNYWLHLIGINQTDNIRNLRSDPDALAAPTPCTTIMVDTSTIDADCPNGTATHMCSDGVLLCFDRQNDAVEIIYENALVDTATNPNSGCMPDLTTAESFDASALRPGYGGVTEADIAAATSFAGPNFHMWVPVSSTPGHSWFDLRIRTHDGAIRAVLFDPAGNDVAFPGSSSFVGDCTVEARNINDTVDDVKPAPVDTPDHGTYYLHFTVLNSGERISDVYAVPPT